MGMVPVVYGPLYAQSFYSLLVPGTVVT